MSNRHNEGRQIMLRSRILAATVVLAGLAATACSKSDVVTAPGTVTNNASSAAQFNHMGDSVLASGGSTSDAAPFYGAAGVIGQSPNSTAISVSVDGASISMNAVAVAMEVV